MMRRSQTSAATWLLPLALLAAAAATPAARAQSASQPVQELEGIDFDQKPNALLPLDAEFTNDSGQKLALRSFFVGTRPVILTLNYYRCPMLCGLMLNGMLMSLKEVNLEPGKDYEIVTISFDPLETAALARAKKQNYINEFDRPGAAAGWHFLVGDKNNIHALTEAVGFHYRWNEARQEWAHPAAMIICTPDGRISRYLGGVLFDSPTVRLSLVEASQGKIGTLWDQIFLTCFHYVSSEGKYIPFARNIMRLGGVLTVLALGGVLLTLWRLDMRRRRRVLTPQV